jgi:PAS domain S-box-containing protein
MPEQNMLKWNSNWAETALNNSSDSVLWTSANGTLVGFNASFSKTSGYKGGEGDSLSLFDLDENLSTKQWKEIWHNLQVSGSGRVETVFNYNEDNTIEVELSFSLVEGGEVCMVCVRDATEHKELQKRLVEANLLIERIVAERSEGSKTTLNALTERKEALEKLQGLQKHHESILQSAGEGIYGLDHQGFTTFANAAAVNMVGWSLEEMVGKSQHALIHHTKTDGTVFNKEECCVYAAFRDGNVHHIEDEVFWRKDGSSFPVEYISTPVFDEDKNIIGTVVSFKDITRRKEAEEALIKSNYELKEALSEVKKLKVRLEQENKYLQQEIKLVHNFEEIISQSKKFKKVLGQVEQVAKTDATVLILGESGTGKELIARAVHNISKRKSRVMVKVNCASLPATLIESELFGHEKGAFTGAISRKVGRFELADGGTLFLDEVGEIPIELQSKLLRVLQEGEFERLGSNTTLKVDVRIVAATNVNLQEAVAKGTFRQDLYYRLNVFPVSLPALRERKEDIPLLTRHFLLKFNAQFGKRIELITEGVIESLTAYSWPGNIRELENVIERAVIISPKRKLEIGDSIPLTHKQIAEQEVITLADNERAHILKTLSFTNWRISGEQGAAKILDINRTTLEARMKKLGISRP